MEAFAAVVAAFALLSAGVTKVVDLLRNLFDKTDKFPKWVWNIVAFVVGIATAVGWNQNLTAEVAALIPAVEGMKVEGVPGEVLTGIAMGGFAGFWHELLDSLSGIAKRGHGQVTTIDHG